MKTAHFWLFSISIALMSSCGTNKKDDKRDTGLADSVAQLEKPDSVTSQQSPAETIGTNAIPRQVSDINEKDKILANIDQYLVSTADINAGVLKVENKLRDVTISRAYADVAVLDASNKILRSSILILDNIRPGESKSVRIPNIAGAASIVSHIVRLKSDELTNGEALIVGSRYTPR